MLSDTPINSILYGTLVFSLPLAILLSYIFLNRYRRAVQRSMMKDSGARSPESLDIVPNRSGGQKATLVLEDARKIPLPSEAFLKKNWSEQLRQGLVYLFAGLIYAGLVTFLFFTADETMDALPVRTTIIYLLFAIPAVHLFLKATISQLQNRLLFLLGILIIMGLVAWLPVVEWLFLCLYYVGIPYLVLVLFNGKKIRTVGPFMLVICSGFVLALMAGMDLALWVFSATNFVLNEWLVLGGAAVLVLGSLFILLRLFIRLIARRYDQQKSSDLQIQQNVFFLIFNLWHASILFFIDPKWSLGVLAGFLLFKLVEWIGLKLAFGSKRNQPGSPLLLLRVFRYRKRTEQFLRQLSFFWRFSGPIQLIAGPDLAGENLEPHEIYSFLSNKISKEFIKNYDELEERVRGNYLLPDPDGRYRVNEFFCYDNTWKQALEALLKGSRFVVMDLRSFSKKNAGCIYEIQQLISQVPTEKLLFLIDQTTDGTFLKEVLEKIWGGLSPDSPNYSGDRRVLHLFKAKEDSPQEYKALRMAIYGSINW